MLDSYGFNQQVRPQRNTINYAQMREHWKSELFRPNLSESSLDHLGFPMSTAQGRRILDICHDTWKRWEVIAMSVPEYKLQDMKLKKMSSQFSAIAPIVPYQVWVVGKVGEVFNNLPHGLPKKWMAQEYLNAKKDEFTRAAYQEEQARHTSLILN